MTICRIGDNGITMNRIKIPCPPWGLDLGNGSRPDTEPDPRITMLRKAERGVVSTGYTLIKRAIMEVRDEWDD